MVDGYKYTGNRAGAIASGVFIGGVSFNALFMLMVFFVVAPEGAPQNIRQDDFLLLIGTGFCAVLAAVIGVLAKRFFDRRAGR